MTTTIFKKTLPATLLLAALCSAGAAWSKDGVLPPETLALYGGRWSTDCANAAAPALQVLEDTLVVQRGKRRIVGREPDTAHSFFGNQPPPPNFDVALMSRVGKGDDAMMNFLVFRDARGQSITLKADKPVVGQLGPELMKSRYWRCDGPARAAAPPAEPAVAAKPPAPATGSPAALARGPAMDKAWRAALGTRENDRWLVRREGPAPEPQWVTVDGTRYVLHAFCKPHDCYDHNAIALYDQGSGRLYGLVQRNGRNQLVGSPSPQFAGQLDRLWREQWRAKN